LATLGLAGSERKHLVPVDWVSSVIGHVLCRPEHHGKTYHLTGDHPVRVSEIAGTIQEAVETYGDSLDESDQMCCSGEWFEKSFCKELSTYRSYWRDDPHFDRANTAAAAPHLPCPRVDRRMMMMMAKYAIDANFGRRRVRPVKPEFDAHRHLRGLVRAWEESPEVASGRACVGLQVDGPGGGQWRLILERGRPIAAERGLGPHSAASLHLDSKTFGQLAAHQLSVAKAVRLGRVVVEENGMTSSQLLPVLEAAARPSTAPALAERDPSS